jgi:hypothetical protein
MAQASAPSTPSPETQVLLAAAIRAILAALGGVGITWGAKVDQSTVEIAAGALSVIAALGWSVWQKFWQAKLDHAGNVASARQSKAIRVLSKEGIPPL